MRRSRLCLSRTVTDVGVPVNLPVMRLLRLEATNFRNLTGAIEFSPGLNLIYGANAQGKSSWLEAIYLLATTKSFRTSHPKEIVTHDAGEAVLRASLARGILPRN